MSNVEFAVLGLPRSGTTWLSNWLTTDTTLCLHDPFSQSLPEQWSGHGKRLGISCTGAYLMPAWLETLSCPVAIIERDPAECNAGLEAIGYPPTDAQMRCLFATARGRRWRFEDIWNEDEARKLWAFLLPDVPFDAPRYRLLTQMRIEPHLGKWKANAGVIHALADRNLFAIGD